MTHILFTNKTRSHVDLVATLRLNPDELVIKESDELVNAFLSPRSIPVIDTLTLFRTGLTPDEVRQFLERQLIGRKSYQSQRRKGILLIQTCWVDKFVELNKISFPSEQFQLIDISTFKPINI